MDRDERNEADRSTEQGAPEPDAMPNFGAGHTSRGLRVRLIAFVLLLGVSAAFIDFSGLVGEVSRDPLRSSDLSIDSADLPPSLVLVGHGIEEIDGQTFVAIRLAWSTPPAPAGSSAPRLRATLFDAQGDRLGWQRLEASPKGISTAQRDPTYRLQLPEGVRPARIALEGAE